MTSDVIDAVREGGAELVERTFSLAERSQAFAETTATQLTDFLDERAQTEETTIAEQLVKLAIPAAAVVLTVQALRK